MDSGCGAMDMDMELWIWIWDDFRPGFGDGGLLGNTECGTWDVDERFAWDLGLGERERKMSGWRLGLGLGSGV